MSDEENTSDVPLDSGLDQVETPDVTRGREKFKEAREVSEREDPMIVALLEERRGYVMHGKKDRVKQVDAALKRLGYEDEKPAKRPAPEGRESRSDKQSTATASKKSEG